MLNPLEAEGESFHASAAAFLRPQSSSLRDHQHPAARDRARPLDSERFKRKFVTTLAHLRGELGFRIGGDDAKTLRRELATMQPASSSQDLSDYNTFVRTMGAEPGRPGHPQGPITVKTFPAFGCVVPIATKSSCAAIRRRVNAPFLSDQPSRKTTIDSRRQAAILEVAE
jgi:hypothetical protein